MRNLKKVIALVAVFAMMVTSVAFAQSYSDVKEDDNYYEAIEMLSKLNILTGDDKDGDGVMDFRPNDTITRAEVAAVVCRIQNLNGLSQTATPFTDVPSSHWASGYVAQAAGQGIINGYGDGNFGPEDEVTYEQAVKMFVETLGYTPFVNANGGYPTGHLTAAARYGVLDGVVGASVGAQATRGQVAQMAFNAIDTPLMDRSSYGKDEEFTIFDGTNNKSFETLLTRDLKVKKFAGVIKSNQVTSLTAPVTSIDTDKKAEVEVKWDGSYNASGDLTSYSTDNANYAVKDINKLYEAESGAGQLLGYFVDGYAKETDRSGEYDIIAVAASNKNKTESFSLDKFSSATDGTAASSAKIEYYKNDNDNKTTSLTVDTNANILYNGVAYGSTAAALNAALTAVKVNSNCTYSGEITVIDNDTTNGYDVVKVDVASSAVVKEVKSSGKVNFKESAKNSLTDKIELDFDEDVTDTVINLTKDGKAVAYTDLQEWDVLSILYSGKANYYDVKVINSTKLDSSIGSRAKSETSADGYEYTIDGNTYDVAEGCYEAKAKNVGWTVGTAGVFYVDDYGKIVAYDKNGSTTSSTTNGNYAYILNSAISNDGFNNVISLQMLTKDGKVVEADLNEKVRFENGLNVVGGIVNGSAAFDDQTSYNVNDLDGTKKDALVAALKNTFVTYEANANGDVRTITFWKNDDETTLNMVKAATSYEYDEDTKEIKVGSKFDVDDDTVIFFIKSTEKSGSTEKKFGDVTAANGKFTFGGTATTASKTASKVGKASQLGDGTSNTSAVVFDEDNGVAGAIVLFDTTGGISSSSNIAVIDSIGEANLDDVKTTSVTYYKGGVKMESLVDTDLSDDKGLSTAKRGDIYKFSLNGDGTVITDVEKYAGVTPRDDSTVTGFTQANLEKALAVTGAKVGSKYFYGPVYDYQSSGSRIRIATTTDGSAFTFANTESIKTANANVYVIDPNKKNNQLTVGDASDVDYDKDLNDEGTKGVKVTKGTSDVTVTPANTAYGLMDFVIYATNADDDVIDVVIYKAYDFGKWSIVD